jgi:hypothetical protein
MSLSFTVSSNQIINIHARRSSVGRMYCSDGFYGNRSGNRHGGRSYWAQVEPVSLPTTFQTGHFLGER